jgi:hypothetical protein
MGHTLLILAVYVLACARLTRILNGDTILDPVRLWIAGRSLDLDRSASEKQRWGKLLYWVECPWCAGLWICLLSAYLPVWLIGWPWWALFPVGLAASHLIGVFAFTANTDDIEKKPA